MKKVILGLAFLGLGTFAMAQQKEAKKMDKVDFAQKQEQKLQKMKSELGLNDAQVAKIKAIQERRREEMSANLEARKADRTAKMEEMKAKREKNDAEMKAILTPEQYTRWEAIKAEKMKDREGKMKNKEGKMQKRSSEVRAAETVQK